ncbi:MAG: hypothetical protein CMD35_07045, partial [Flavobacteriales bacterium]|nr:hypothetical protein [Flavobacteriales bacterium]
EVTDGNGCTDTSTVTITEPLEMILGSDSIPATCTGICTGSAIVIPSGGVAPYSQNWYTIPNAYSDTLSGLCAGFYNVKVVDFNGCTDTLEVEVTEPVTVTAFAVDSIATTCNGGSDGWAVVGGSGGTEPYSYWWDDELNQVNDTAVGLSTGIYKAAVTDFNGCNDTVEITINQPDTISPNDSISHVSCAGQCDGIITLNVTGGTRGAGYTHSWSVASTDTFVNTLCAGTYTDTITDGAGCLDTFSFVVTEPDTLETAISDTTHILCYGDSTGIAVVTPSGGTSPYTYDWYDAPGSQTDSTATGLPSGTYNVEVTDGNGCTDTSTVTITEPLEMVLGSDSIPATCAGTCTGSAIVISSGGVGPYTYDWFDAGGQVNDTAIALCTGFYNVQVTDFNSCIDTLKVEVTEPLPVVASGLDSSATTCHDGSDGWAVVEPSGGISPYAYWWDDELNQTSDTAINLSSRLYFVAVIDSNGCSDTTTIKVEQPDSISPNESITNISCAGLCDGGISLDVTGGTEGSGYSHSWNIASTDTFINSLCADTYIDTITDGVGCKDTFFFVVTQPDTLRALFSDTMDVVCSNSRNGQAIVTPEGGTPIYKYDWYDVPGGDIDSVASGLLPGTYHVEVTDANGCIDTGEIVINSPPPLVLTSDSVPSTCSGICDGIAIVNSSGGTAPYDYYWFDNIGVNNDSLTNACAGNYTVEVTDNNGCKDTIESVVTQPVTVVASLLDTSGVTCFGGSDGMAVINGSGGTEPYSFWWSDELNQTNDTASGLKAGTYYAAVIDSNGCSDTVEVIIETPADWAHVKDSTRVTCYSYCDAQITITPAGGTGPYFHKWNTGSFDPTIINLCEGKYTDTISDSRGCLDTVEVMITQPDSLQLTPVLIQNVGCYGDNTAMAYATGSGGTTPYSFEWGAPVISTNDTLYSAVAGTYTILLRDSMGCTDINSIELTQPDELTTLISDTVHANCVCNASAAVTPTGGTTPYTYKWNDINNTTDSLAENLCTGEYFVEVTDSNGCFDTSFVTIRDTSVFTISLTDTGHVSCNGVCDGYAIVTPNQGTAPFTYLWNNPGESMDSSAMSLCAGPVSVTVTDDEGCVRFASINIQQPEGLMGVSGYNEPLCNGDTNGSAWVTVSGGVEPYEHSWDLGSTNDSLYNVGLGVYTDTITDANGCFDTVTVNVSEPEILLGNLDSLNVTCHGSSNGSVWSAPSGGTSPYHYLWNDAGLSSSDSLSGLDSGVYTVVVTDFNGCAFVDSIAVFEPPMLNSTITDTAHVACYCTGIASVTPVGGTAPYTYLWNDLANQSDSTAINLCAGDYEVLVVDANGCTDTSFVTIRDTSGFFTDIVDSTMIECYGVCNGSALVRAENGVQPYDFIWDDQSNTNDSLVNNLCSGTYTVTISDAIGCTHVQSVTITEVDSLQITLIDTSVSCNGNCDGSVEVVVSGGTHPYTYQWDDQLNSTTRHLDSLCIGSYIVQVSDSNGCSTQDTISISEPPELVAFINPYTPVSCKGQNDASLTAMPTGGISPYTYLWSSGEDTKVITGKGPNTYSVTITDSLNCKDDTSLVVIEPEELVASITDTTHLLCGDVPTGSATVTPSGGTGPYHYDWYDAPGNQTDSICINLSIGTYSVAVFDSRGCSDTTQITITGPPVLSASITNLTTASCDICDGTATVTPFGGVGPFTYNWYNAPVNSGDSLVNSLCASSYNVSVIDANGCIDTAEVTITGPSGFTARVVDTSMVTCNGLSDGFAVALGEGGKAPYQFLWSDLSATENDSVAGLSEGTYSVIVSDDNGCNAFASVVITQPDALNAEINTTVPTECSSTCTGSATVDVSGGTSPYNYIWDDLSSQTSPTALNLCAAQYSVRIADALGCKDTASILIVGPDDLTVAVDSIVNVSCKGNCDGMVAITPMGGVGEYTYVWNDSAATEDTVLTNLCAGQLSAQITDENGCVAFANVSIEEPEELVVTISDSSNVVCYEGESGWASVSITGGTMPYSIAWNDGALQTTDTAKSLVAGTYTVTVTDVNGCSKSAAVTIEQPEVITATISSVEHVLCTGFCIGKATLIVSGGTVGGGYTYLWENGGDAPTGTELCSGSQTYTVTDGVGCSLTDSVEIIDQNDFTATSEIASVSCNGDCDGKIVVTPSGGISPYRHSWNTGEITDSIIDLCPGIYIDTIFDDNGCFRVDSFEIEEPDIFAVSIINSIDLRCYGNCEGKAVVQGSGGISPYKYNWYNAPGNQEGDTATELCAATYFVRGEDENGCLAEDTVSLNQPSQILLSLDSSSAVSCYGLCDGKAALSSIGGTGTIAFEWLDSNNLSSRIDLCGGDYLVYALDENSCLDSIALTISEPDSLDAFITDTSHIVCATVCDGEAIVGHNGGTGPFVYDWYDAGGISSNQITGQCAGSYNVEVTDSNGCVDTATVQINDVNLLTVSTLITHVSCTGECDGKLSAQPTGGIGPYEFLWSDSSILDSVENLCPGNYSVTVTDSKGCQTSVGGEIIEPLPLTSSIIDSSDLDCYDICDGYATVSPSGGTEPYTYLWNNSSGETSLMANGLCAAPYSVIVTDGKGCKDTTYVNLNQPDSIEISIIENQANCTNSYDGSVDITVSGGTGAYNYFWEGNNYTSAIEDASGMAIGLYTITVTDENGCLTQDTALITESNFINAYAGEDTTVCEADSLVLSGSGGVLYSWSDGGTTQNHTVAPTVTTTYILNVFNNGCSDTDTVVININALPDIDVIASDYLILEGTSTQLVASGAGTGGFYDWNPPIGLNDPTIYDPSATLDEATTYIVRGEDQNGCSDTASVRIDVASSIIFSDGITPNGDGLNDTWVIKLIEEFPGAKVYIYNRWGQKVFESTGYLSEWDGTSNNKKLPIGTYYYLIDLGPNQKKHTGPITIMR